MKVFSLATLTLKRNKKQYMIYGLTLIFAIVIHLIFSEFINNPYLIEADRARGIDDPLGADIPLSMGLPFLIILFCWFMIIYASQYNFNKKHQEFGILFTCGFNLLDFIKYTLIQMGIVFIFVLPISFILGVLSLFFIHSKIYPYLQINYSIYTIMPSTFFTTISALCVLVVIVIIFLIGQLHKSDIYTLINDENKVQAIHFVSLKKMMMMGIPMIVSDLPNNREIIENGINGFLASGDEDWYEKLELLINKNDLREEIAINARRKLEQKFSYENTVDIFINAIRRHFAI